MVYAGAVGSRDPVSDRILVGYGRIPSDIDQSALFLLFGLD
jgi:hypothetical protein